MRVLVAGSRNFTDTQLMYMVLADLLGPTYGPQHTIVQGFARGADRIAYEWGKSYRCKVESYLPKWDIHGKSAGYVRNKKMVDDGADICLIFYGPSGETRGTKHTEMLARAAGIPVKLYYEDTDPYDYEVVG